MKKTNEMSGERFGRLVVTGFLGKTKQGRLRWICKCDCGNDCVVNGTSLRLGLTKSCGCLKSDTSTVDLLGKRFGRLTVISRAGTSKNSKAMWLVKCDCGKTKVVLSSVLINGDTRSCGCLNMERITKHGQGYSRLYQVWADMKQRCLNPKNTSYQNYGGRGISICEHWLDPKTFFDWALENGYCDDLSIDRINGSGNYEPDNCRFIPLSKQHDNKRTNRIIEYRGETDTLMNLCRKYGRNYNTVRYRLNAGYSVEEAFEIKLID